MLGMPKGFNRCGREKLIPNLFAEYANEIYNMFNVPVWKYQNKEGHVFVRGLSPRINETFLHVFLKPDNYDKINCLEITDADLEKMD